MYNVTLRHVCATTVTVEKKQLSIIYFECAFVALVIQHAVRVSRVIPSFVGSVGILFHIFLGEKIIKHKMCVKFFSTTCLKCLSFYAEFSGILL
jgi:hypothetical protein